MCRPKRMASSQMQKVFRQVNLSFEDLISILLLFLLCPTVLESLWQYVFLWALTNISCLSSHSVQVCGSKAAKGYKEAALGDWPGPDFGQFTPHQPSQLHLRHSPPGISLCMRQVIGLCLNSGHLQDQSHFSKNKRNNTWKPVFS